MLFEMFEMFEMFDDKLVYVNSLCLNAGCFSLIMKGGRQRVT